MKLRSCLRVTLIILLIASWPPWAETAEKRVPTSSELVEGEGDGLEVADKKLNVAYQKLLGILDNDGKATLREAQRKWVAWRDAQAEFDAQLLRGGKLWQMERNGSTAGLTEKRTIQLQGDYKRFKEG